MQQLTSNEFSKTIVTVTACFLSFCMTGLSGCGGGSELHPLSGIVTFQGEPVPLGSLTFIPDEEAGNEAPRLSLQFENGQYQTTEGTGVSGGKYTVEIDGFKYDQALDDNEPEAIRMFPIYQLKVEIPPNGGNYDFVLPVDNKSPEKT